MRSMHNKKGSPEVTSPERAYLTKHYRRDDEKDITLKNQDNNTTIKPITQCDKALEYMRRKGGITPIGALSEFGCFSLAQRIYDLKKRRHSIVTARISKQGMFGKVSFAKYHLDNAGDANG